MCLMELTELVVFTCYLTFGFGFGFLVCILYILFSLNRNFFDSELQCSAFFVSFFFLVCCAVPHHCTTWKEVHSSTIRSWQFCGLIIGITSASTLVSFPSPIERERERELFKESSAVFQVMNLWCLCVILYVVAQRTPLGPFGNTKPFLPVCVYRKKQLVRQRAIFSLALSFV